MGGQTKNQKHHQMNNPDPYPQDSSEVLMWHERRHNAVHEALSLAGIRGAWTKLAEDRVNDLVFERDAANLAHKAWKSKAEAYARERDSLIEEIKSRTILELARADDLEKLRAELEKLRADHDALGNDMDAVCVERDEARDRQQKIADERDVACAELKKLTAENSRLESLDAARVVEVDAVHAKLIEMRKQRDLARRRLEEVFAANERLLAERELILEPKKPEPSRLEIAAMLMMHGWADRSPEQDAGLMLAALKTADALIAAAKEVAK